MPKSISQEQVSRLARKIADEDSVIAIESYGVPVWDWHNRIRWHELDPTVSGAHFAARAARYLEMRGKLIRNPRNPKQVKVRQ